MTQAAAKLAYVDQLAAASDSKHMSTMFERMMQSAQSAAAPAYRQPRPRNPVPVSAPPALDYAALVDVLTQLYQIPDGLGETVLRPDEAAVIRRCGFSARAGSPWRCPPLPDALVS
jgi:hypothetical protein